MNPLLKKIAAALYLLSLSAHAADDLNTVRAEATRKFAGHDVLSVRATPIKGVFEITLAPGQIVYTDAHVDYALAGALIDMHTQVNLTEQRLGQLHRIDFTKLPLAQAIKTIHGNGARKIAVFSDPDCPYCHRLERDTLAKLDNVTIYTFLFPLDQHADAQRKARLIWCAADRSKAWQDWMQDGNLPVARGECVTPLSANLAMGQQLGVRATPTLILSSGELLPGAIDIETLEMKLK